jgi:hypothetical protein
VADTVVEPRKRNDVLLLTFVGFSAAATTATAATTTATATTA